MDVKTKNMPLLISSAACVMSAMFSFAGYYASCSNTEMLIENRDKEEKKQREFDELRFSQLFDDQISDGHKLASYATQIEEQTGIKLKDD